LFIVNSPSLLGSIRNFAWVEPGMLARGEQPALDAATFDTLRKAGVTAVLSLRPDREPPSKNARRPWPEYHVEEEQALAEASGLRFRNVPLTDFSAPPPVDVASALRVVDALLAERPGVYVHCRAGAGRAGLVSAAWAVTRGQSGDDAAESYLHFMEHIASDLNLTDDEWAAFARRVGQPQVWWALREVVDALGSPVNCVPPRRLLPHEAPPEALTGNWSAGYRAALEPWRTSRERLHAAPAHDARR
jgi:protein tyrosine phosphatase (PTP) superfamily phosphohydrolase (DUF442 family)